MDREQGRGICARWCDTDFAHGEPLTAQQLLKRMDAAWPFGQGQHSRRWCVLTGGEPSLQFDKALIDVLRKEGWKVSVETNGTVFNPAFADVDFITLSPKLGAKLQLTECDELKVILPGAAFGTPGWTDDQLKELAASMHSAKLYVQPQDPISLKDVEQSVLHGGDEDLRSILRPFFDQHLQRCIDFVRANPDWALSIQSHKFIGLP